MPDRLPPGSLYASDIGDEHLGRQVSVDGITGTLRAVYHIDSERTHLLVDGSILDVPAGRPIAVAPD